jgi:hypothetical protein
MLIGSITIECFTNALTDLPLQAARFSQSALRPNDTPSQTRPQRRLTSS